MFEGSLSWGKAPRKHLLHVFLAFSVLPFLCMSGGDSKRIAEYDFGCASCFLFCLLYCRFVVWLVFF